NRFYRQSHLPDMIARVAEISFSGNHTIPETAIREIVKIKEGDQFSTDSMDFLMNQLKTTGDFYWVRYTTDNLSENKIRLKILLEEKNVRLSMVSISLGMKLCPLILSIACWASNPERFLYTLRLRTESPICTAWAILKKSIMMSNPLALTVCASTCMSKRVRI
ncbi:MAG: POTRA domain-containing protein, partial [Candidatus Marinimicrobia bacterium]|nr:POTRA domain-containing protein [Candidatus Neomarinimicrobiota bacterium]